MTDTPAPTVEELLAVLADAQQMANSRGGDYGELSHDELCEFMVRYDEAISVIEAAALKARDAAPADGIREALERLRKKVDSHMNAHLCDMKENHDDSITGFNEAWDVVREVFKSALPSAPTADNAREG